MNYRIVSDSSCDLLSLPGADFVSVPLKIRTDHAEYIDNAALNVEQMIDELRSYKGRSTTSCPNVDEWEQAFGNAEHVFVFTITSGLSGSYASACAAKSLCEERNPAQRIHIFDTKTAGPEIYLLIQKLQQILSSGVDFDTACEIITEYQSRTRLLFTLESLHNFAQNGRVSKLAAGAAGLLGIRAAGCASEDGKLELLEKCRGAEKALHFFLPRMEQQGYCGGRVAIGHCRGAESAKLLKKQIRLRYPKAQIAIYQMRGLCCYYAEQGGVLVGYET